MTASAATPILDPPRLYLRNHSNLTPTSGESLTAQVVRKYFPSARETDHGNIWMRDEDATALLTTPSLQIALHESAIREHAARRIRWFYLQVVACYGTGKKFDIATTDYQSDQAYPFTPITPSFSKGAFVTRRQAAHSSIIPSLRVSDGEGIYLNFSDFHRTFNSTVTLPSIVNHPIDTSLERSSTARPERLVHFALKLLNKAADKSLSPEKAVRVFVMVFKKEVDKFDPSGSSADTEALELVVRYYKETCCKWEALLKREPDHFAQSLCRVDYTLPTKTKAEIHRHAEAAIRRSQEVQSELGAMFDTFCEKTFGARRTEPFFWDNVLDYSVRKAPTTVRNWLPQHENYPGDLRDRSTLARVQPGEDRKSVPPSKTTLSSAENLLGSFILDADGRRTTEPMWNEEQQHLFTKTDFTIWQTLSDRIESLWKEEEEHVSATYDVLATHLGKPEAQSVWDDYRLSIPDSDPKFEKVFLWEPGNVVDSDSDANPTDTDSPPAAAVTPNLDPAIFRLHF
jgi:hypothetical protein